MDGTLALARAAAEIGATFVFLSSEYVFDGLEGPYDETRRTRPLNEYGRQKQEVERLLPAVTGGDFMIARVSCLYGHERSGKNFVHQLWSALSEGREFRAPSDQIGTPTAVANAAEVIRELVLRGGTRHLPRGGPGADAALASSRCWRRGSWGSTRRSCVRRRPASWAWSRPRPMGAGLLTGPRARRTGRRLWRPA